MTFSTLASPGVSLQGGGGSGGGGTASLPISGNGATITTSTPLINGTQTWNSGATTFTSLLLNVTDTASASGSLLMDLQADTNSKFTVSKSGTIRGSVLNLWSGAAVTTGSQTVYMDSNGVQVMNTGRFSFSSINNAGATQDTFLTRRAAANLRLGAADTTGTTAPTAQTLSVQSWASSTNNNQPGADFRIDGSQGTGTGAGGSIIFRVAPAGGVANGVQNALVDAVTINSQGNVTLNRSGAGITLGSGGTSLFSGSRGGISFEGNGVFVFYNAAANDFGRLQFGGTTSSFPALKRSSASLQVRLADDTGYTTIDANHRLQGTAPAANNSTGTAGDIRYDADYIYICTATDTWKRVAIATWP